MGLDFPAEADTTRFFFGAEGGPGSFGVQWTGLACGSPYQVDAAYDDVPGSAFEPADYQMPAGRTPPVCEVGCPGQDAQSFNLANDVDPEPVVESFTIALSDPHVDGNPNPSALTPPPSAPFLIVDNDGADRVAFDELAYARSETYSTMTIPVWRAGPATGTATVPYTAGPGPGSPATDGGDFTVTSPNPLTFPPGDRVEVITLSIKNDKVAEPEETIALTLLSPGGAALDAPSSKIVSIQDNEEGVAPTSLYHHPRHKWRYRKSDYRIREFHVFAHDEAGGSGVVAAEIALRRNVRNGTCAWKAKKGWQRRDCDNPIWLTTKYEETGDLFYRRMSQLKSSVDTRIKSYTAFSRAIDGAGNVERDFAQKRNDNTFEVKRTRRRP
jgi:hypothetical protein